MTINLIKQYEQTEEDYANIGYSIEISGQVIGVLNLMISDEDTYLERLDIDEEYRGQGHGTAVIKMLKKDHSILYAAPDNEDSQRLFERIGHEYSDGGAAYVDQGFGVYRV